jgi:Mg2+/Co2+ transporter CorB
MEDSIGCYSIIVLILLVTSALFSCFETAIVGTSRAKIHRLKNEGNRRAKILENLLKNREKVVSTMLLGNNAVNIMASAITTTVFLNLFGNSGLIYATLLMTILVLVFSEILPKSYAIKYPDTISLFFAPMIGVLVAVFFPITNNIQKLVNWFINIFDKNSIKKTSISEMEEIRDTINLKHIEGSIYKYDKDMMDGVLDLADTEITEIMVHRKEIESINIELPTEEIIKQALEISYTRIPLWKDNKENIVAILNVRKLLKALHFYRDGLEKFDLKSIISEPWFIPNTNSLRAQLFAFRKKKKRFALVIDEYGSLLGLITLEDILEEIVGEIKEQEDGLEVNIVKNKSGACKIAGKSLIRDINKKLDWNLDEDGDAYNLAAFVINNLGRIPEERENFAIDNYYFEILQRKGHDLLWIKVRKNKDA